MFWLSDDLTPNSAEREIDIHPANHQVKRLCQECNGAWMAGIEDEAKSTLVDLFFDKPVTLDASAQASLSTWATVVSVLRSTRDPGRSLLAREDLQEIREQTAAPSGFQVWLIHGVDNQDVNMRHYRASIAGNDGWIGWIWFGAAILLVASTNAAPEAGRRLQLLPGAAARIHPAQGPISWPPMNHVDPWPFFHLMTLHLSPMDLPL